MNRRINQDKKGRETGGDSKFKINIKGVNIVRLLVCFILGLNLLLIYSILFSSNGLPGYSKQNDQVRELEGKILKLKQENQKLFEMIQAFKKDPKLQEKLVRQELGWVKENEVVLEFPDKEKDPGLKQNNTEKKPVPTK